MTSAQMLNRVKQRTRHPDDTKIIGELNSAQDWAYSKIYNSEGGPDLLMTFDAITLASGTMSAQTRTYDLGANVSGTLYGVKQLWLRLSNESNFTPMVQMDANKSSFRAGDQYPATDTTSVATGHPVQFEIYSFAKVRFSPPLPSGAVIRLDGWLKPPAIDPTTNPALTYGNDIPEPVHEAICDKATGQVFDLLNDTRASGWMLLAEHRLHDALYLLRGRVQGPVSTTPFNAGRRRWI